MTALLEHPWDKRSVEWDLGPEDTVLELGGYEGRWSMAMAERHPATIHVFEPQPWAAAKCRTRLAAHPNVHVHQYGLGVRSMWHPLGAFGTDGCSFSKPPEESAPLGEMIEFGAAMRGLGVTKVSLMLMNIEGYEYQLLPHLMEQGHLGHIHHLMVQFHEFADPDGSLHAAILDRLSTTHRMLWDYGTTLAAWERLPI